MAKRTANPQETAILPAPTWMNMVQKREFSALVAPEIGWKGYCTEVELEELGDYVDHRSRLAGLRKLMRSALRKRDAALAVSLNGQINATVDKAHRLAGNLSLHDREKAAMESIT
ncbi:hypothetical protein [Mesorhizobium sp. WSM2239]|uniref:Uncharacterized protein n=2 Tax=unclassified Mesorhizobium TaxID=325217 RepID=A0AAU8D6M8_9HYPH